jgi:hypothetical protein
LEEQLRGRLGGLLPRGGGGVPETVAVADATDTMVIEKVV